MKIKTFKPTYKREDGLTVIYDSSIPFPGGIEIKVRGIVVFPPGAKGGNHKHPRIEAFYSPGALTVVWIDKDGKKHKESMSPRGGKFRLFITKPGEPHAIINNTNREISLVEYANEEQYGVEAVSVA